MIDSNNSIIRIIISNLLKSVKEIVESSCNSSLNFNIKSFNKNIVRVFRILKTINNGKSIDEECDEESAAEALLDIADTFSLIKKLVDSYLDIVNANEKNKNKYLVIIIDDMDLNIKHSFKMIDEIRKYLQIDNVIILMAMKMEQLSDAIKIRFNDDFKGLEKIDSDEEVKEKVVEATEKFLEKLYPANRKIYLPDIRIDNPIINNNENTNIIDEFFKIIYRKTGIILIKPDKGIHRLIPSNIREFKNFYFFMKKMEDIDDAEKNIELRIKQLEKFEKYILNNYTELHFNFKDRKFIRDFLNEISEENRNKSAIQYLSSKINLEKLKEIKKHEIDANSKFYKKISDFINLSQKTNSASNITLGDVLFYMEMIEQIETDNTLLKLISVIKLVYSIELNKIFYTYKYLKYNHENDKSTDDENDLNENTRYTIYLEKLESLINGSFRGSLIEHEIRGIQSNPKISRVNFKIIDPNKNINYFHIKDMEFFKYIKDIEKYISSNDKSTDIFYDDIISYFYTNAFLTYTEEYKKKNAKRNIYYEAVSRNHPNAIFDIFNFFVYLIDEKYLLGRFYGDSISDIEKYRKEIPEIFEAIKNIDKVLFIGLNTELLLKISNAIESYNYTEKDSSYTKTILLKIFEIIADTLSKIDFYGIRLTKKFKENYFLDYIQNDFLYSMGFHFLDYQYNKNIGNINLSPIIQILNKEIENLDNNIEKGSITYNALRNRLNKSIKKINAYKKEIDKIEGFNIDDLKINSSIKGPDNKVNKGELKRLKKKIQDKINILKNKIESFDEKGGILSESEINIPDILSKEINFFENNAKRKNIFINNENLFNNRIKRIIADLESFDEIKELKSFEDLKNTNIQNYEELVEKLKNIKKEFDSKTDNKN